MMARAKTEERHETKGRRAAINYLTTLPSGMSVIWDDYGSLGTTAMAFYVRVGARDERPSQYGAAHFLEHAVFKGAGAWSARDIANIQDQLGGEINAFTTRDYTVYYAKVLASKASQALELLWTLISEPWLTDSDIGKERQVILEELLEAQDDLEDRSSELYMAAMFPDPTFHHDVLGTTDSLYEFNGHLIRNFHREFYFPANIVLVLSGDGVEALRERVQNFTWPFAVQGTYKPRKPVTVFPQIRILQQPGEQVHLTMGVPAPVLGDTRHDATVILSTILAGQNTSRLWQRLREDEGLVYIVSTSYSALQDWAELSIYMALSPRSVPRALQAVREEIQLLMQYPPSQQEREWALTQSETSMAFAMETPEGRMMRLGSYGIYGLLPSDPHDRLAQLERVNCDDVMILAQQLFSSGPWAFAACGPIGSVERVLQEGFRA